MKKIIKKFLKIFNLELKRLDEFNSELPIECSAKEEEFIKIAKKFSMTDYKSLYAVCQSIKYIKQNNIKGDLVECGVWQGGNLILFNKLLNHHKIKKKIFGYDTFSGMTAPGQEDNNFKNLPADNILKQANKINNEDNIWCYSSYKSVKKNIRLNCQDSKNILLIKGDVRKTLPKKKIVPKKISLLRLDTDFYDSTKIELEILYPLLSKNGILIIDDYGYWKGARKAVDEFFFKTKPWMHVINNTCRLIIKK